MTWRELAALYPNFAQWPVQRHGPLPEGDVRREDYERLAAEYEARATMSVWN